MVEVARAGVLALLTAYPTGHRVPPHRHSRAQLFYPVSGAVLVTTEEGRWMVPPEHALWIPAGMEHDLQVQAEASVHLLYVQPGAVAELPERCRVVGMTDLMRSLILEAATLPRDAAEGAEPGSRAALVMALLTDEIP